MPGNEFEKQVQQKMDELNFVPSDAVWHEVEKQIAPRKKRRLLVWLPVLVLLLGGAMWMFNTARSDAPNKHETISKTGSNTPAAAEKNKNAAGSPATAPTPNNAKDAADEKAVAKKQQQLPGQPLSNTSAVNEEQPAHKKTNTNGTTKKYSETDDRRTAGLSKNSPGTNTNVALSTTIVRNNISIVKNTRPLKQRPAADNALLEKPAIDNNVASGKIKKEGGAGIDTIAAETVAVAAPPIVTAQMPDTAAAQQRVQPNTAAAEKPKTLQPADSVHAIAKNKKASNHKKLEWGINIQAGRSSISQGVTSLFKSAPAYDVNSTAFANSPNNATGSPSGGLNSGSTGAPPSDVHAGFAYALGGFIALPAGKQLTFTAGLNYAYSSTRITVGGKVYNANQTVSMYNTGSATNYTNQFHFIELPLTLQKQWGKSSRFSTEGGFALSVLAGSSVLLYDASQNKYVAEKSYINKIQANLLAGVSYRLFPARRSIEIGPRVSYGLANMFKKDLYGSTHLFFAGVQAKIFLSKK